MRLSALLVTLTNVGCACGGVVDATVNEAGAPDAKTTSDVDMGDALNLDAEPAQTYYDFSDPARWSRGVSGWVIGSDADSDRAYGGAFDGRYVYELAAFVGAPLKLRRYDTKLPVSSRRRHTST